MVDVGLGVEEQRRRPEPRVAGRLCGGDERRVAVAGAKVGEGAVLEQQAGLGGAAGGRRPQERDESLRGLLLTGPQAQWAAPGNEVKRTIRQQTGGHAFLAYHDALKSH